MGSVGAFASGFLISRLSDWERLVSENQQLKQRLAEEKKSHEENCQEWRKDFSEQNQIWEEHVYKLCREIERLKIADSEKDYKIKQLKQQLAAYQQQLEVNLSNNFDELN
jgi:predicted RNase H-like nuclease (RuvC/YqgF family)